MTDRDPEQWRDPERLPLDDLSRAMGTYSNEGQTDDSTGGDAGAEEAFGDEPWTVEEEESRDAQRHGDPDPETEEGRRMRPSPHGRIGPV
ncbi:MAG TPA: hypothetical protein VF054_18655 [Micromonosporaceae bacterium]